MNYGVCAVIALTQYGKRQVIQDRSATRGNWVEIDGVDRQFPDLQAAREYARKNNL